MDQCLSCRLDACWSQFAEFMQETEARVAVRPATIEGQAEKSIEVGARVTFSCQKYTQLQRESD